MYVCIYAYVYKYICVITWALFKQSCFVDSPHVYIYSYVYIYIYIYHIPYVTTM